MALEGDQTGLLHFADLCRRQISWVAHGAGNEADCHFDALLLQNGVHLGIIVEIAVIRRDEDGLFVVVQMIQILEEDRFIAVLLQILHLFAEDVRRNEQLLFAPDVVTDAMVHQYRDLPPGGDGAAAQGHAGDEPGLRFCIRQQPCAHQIAEDLQRQPVLRRFAVEITDAARLGACKVKFFRCAGFDLCAR